MTMVRVTIVLAEVMQVRRTHAAGSQMAAADGG
jgi:hypothetical protein